MAQSKATKRFEKNRLPAVLKKRKEFAKVKQKIQMKAKKKAKRVQDNAAEDDGSRKESERPAKKQKQHKDSVDDMTVDDFFSKGLPSHITNGKSKPSRPGKRKHQGADEEDDELSSIASVEEHANFGDSASESEGENDGQTHKDDLKRLAQKDPEFYKYLQDNDAELLEFEENTDLAELDPLLENDDADVEPENPDRGTSKDTEPEGHVATKAMVKKWSSAMSEKQSLRATREVVLAFRAAAHLNEDTGKTYKYTISSADVYHDVLLCALQKVPVVLNHHLPIKELANGKIRLATDSKKYQTLAPLLKSHTMAVQHLLENLDDAGTLTVTLTSLLALVPYTLSFKKLVRDLVRSIVEVWSNSARDEATRIHAFLVIRRLVLISDASIKESVLRTAYQGLIKGSRITTIHNLSGINLMKNSAAELWGLAEPNVAYTTAFTFIRQLAIHLRNCIKHNAKESYKNVYNWQYVHSLDFWSRVLAVHCDTLREASQPTPSPNLATSKDSPARTPAQSASPLRPLIYPVTQLTLGTMRLIPTPAYFPLRFHLTRALLRLSRTTNTYIPLAAPLYEVLSAAELRNPAKPSTLAPLDFATTLRAGKQYLRTRVYQDGVAAQAAELLGEFFALWCKSIAFPELALPVTMMLRRWLKQVGKFAPTAAALAAGQGRKPGARGNRNSRVSAPVVLLVQKLEANSRWIEERRSRVGFAPRDRAAVEGFLQGVEWTETPMGAFVQGQRKTREERERVLEEARQLDERQRKKDEALEREERGGQMEGFESGDSDEGGDGEGG